jgi:hypothetical protein
MKVEIWEYIPSGYSVLLSNSSVTMAGRMEKWNCCSKTVRRKSVMSSRQSESK